MDQAAPLPDLGSVAGGVFAAGAAGIRMLVEHPRHRTVFPRADCGTASTFRQLRFGHMIRRWSFAMAVGPAFSNRLEPTAS